VSPPVVAALGEATTHFVGLLPRLPDSDAYAPILEVSLQVGGAAATAVAASVGLGCTGRLCTRLAGDAFGDFILDGLANSGIDVGCVLRGEGRLSPFAFTALGREDGQIHNYGTSGDARAPLPAEVPVDQLLADAQALLIDARYPAAQAEAAEAASRREIPVVLDASRVREGLGELIALSDVFIASERLASDLAPRGELQDSLMELQQMGPRGVIVTLGEQGSLGLFGDQLVRQPSLRINTVDTIGAGHVFHGAFAAAIARGNDFAYCMQYASAAAALSCTARGGWAGIPGHDDVVARLD